MFRFSDPVYGGTIDYVYDTLGVTHSYTIELRPPADGFSREGFILPACHSAHGRNCEKGQTKKKTYFTIEHYEFTS